jgi:hypothetical protein
LCLGGWQLAEERALTLRYGILSKEETTMRRRYGCLETFVANVPYLVMIVLGTATIVAGFDITPWTLCGAAGYAAYGIVGALWVMVFICPSCGYYGTDECPCGYGRISAKLVRQRERSFTAKFRKHIPVIVPVWIIPVVCGIVSLYGAFSWLVLALMLGFALDAYFLLPLVAKKRSCAQCPQKDDCPWMAT